VGRKKKTLVRQPDPPSKWPRWTGFRGKTAWDWMQLLIVPLVLTVLGLSFAIAQQVISNLQQELRQQQIEEQRAAAERDIADQQAQDEALEAYLNVMKELLLEQDLRDSGPDSNARAVANVQTLLILERVAAHRKGVVLRLLTESHLIDAEAPLIETSTLSFQEATAEGIDLSDTDLSRANFEVAFLRYANLRDADLSGANLSRAILEGADLRGANLTRTSLSGADLTNAEVTKEQLLNAESLKGATMPNGQKYEAWRNSKDRKENGQNSGS
jgi:uncharacterized protein YjbI with pentapeptide repeats